MSVLVVTNNCIRGYVKQGANEAKSLLSQGIIKPAAGMDRVSAECSGVARLKIWGPNLNLEGP